MKSWMMRCFATFFVLTICLTIMPSASYAKSTVQVPAKAKLVSVKAGKTDVNNKAVITVKWKKINKDITGYELYQKTGKKKWKVAKTLGKKKTTCTVVVKGGEKNYFKIRAINKKTVAGKTTVKKGQFSKTIAIQAEKYQKPKPTVVPEPTSTPQPTITPKYLIKSNDIQVYFTGNYLDDTTYGGDVALKQLHLETVIENNTGTDIKIYAKDVSINGWEVFGQWQYSSFWYIESGKKAKLYLYCNLANANINTFADVKEFELKVIVEDYINSSTLLETDSLRFVVNR